jgi:hypothetical protein
LRLLRGSDIGKLTEGAAAHWIQRLGGAEDRGQSRAQYSKLLPELLQGGQ